jgi:hypothetical protein
MFEIMKGIYEYSYKSSPYSLQTEVEETDGQNKRELFMCICTSIYYT